ncbi:MAG: hypothetical protein AAGF90_15340 [Pseudomonadota bacterium]
MWWSDRRGVLALAAGGALSACGFRPMLAEGEGGEALRGTVVVAEARDPETYAYRERLRRRLGDPSANAAWRLEYQLRFEEDGVAIEPDSDITRFQVAAVARWRLRPLAGDAEPIEGQVRAAGAYDAASEPFATLSARRAEREEMATELAERTASRIFALIAAESS